MTVPAQGKDIRGQCFGLTKRSWSCLDLDTRAAQRHPSHPKEPQTPAAFLRAPLTVTDTRGPRQLPSKWLQEAVLRRRQAGPPGAPGVSAHRARVPLQSSPGTDTPSNRSGLPPDQSHPASTS